MSGPYGQHPQPGPQGPAGSPPPGWNPQQGPSASNFSGPSGQPGPAAPATPATPASLAKTLGLVSAGAAVLAFFLTLLDTAPGYAYAIPLLFGGLLALAPLLPKAGNYVYAAAVIPASVFLGLLFVLFSAYGTPGAGYWLVLILALVQAAAAVGAYLMTAGILKPSAPHPHSPSSGGGQYGPPPGFGPSGGQGPQQSFGPPPSFGPPAGFGPPSGYGPSAGVGTPGQQGPGSQVRGQQGPASAGFEQAPSYGQQSQQGQQPPAYGQSPPAQRDASYGQQASSGFPNMTKDAPSAASSAAPGLTSPVGGNTSGSGFASAPTTQVSYAQMQEVREAAAASDPSRGAQFASQLTTFGPAPTAEGAANIHVADDATNTAGANDGTGPVPTFHNGQLASHDHAQQEQNTQHVEPAQHDEPAEHDEPAQHDEPAEHDEPAQHGDQSEQQNNGHQQ
ncbi:DUF5336 domain-containing protein [Nakamurella antarctica]|uniref:DUF5336 domain-containing protein n=1 Tax=Nakamurella antarctica TaxID=1902245 RepID=UPI0013DE17BD|nr:DUF5336 domain-containing protein [Nakamurella antarctica]